MPTYRRGWRKGKGTMKKKKHDMLTMTMEVEPETNGQAADRLEKNRKMGIDNSGGKIGVIKEKKIPLFQRVELTEEEVRDAADRMADLFDQVGRIEEEQKSIANNYKAKIKEVEAQLSQAQLLVRNKYDQRLVDCIRSWNIKTCRVVTARLDTGAIVEERAMTADERQEKLFPDETE
jgi:hypothetical protein